jgi:hypothetical protein
MPAVREPKRRMVKHSVDLHLDIFKKTGVELIVGSGRFTGVPQLWKSHYRMEHGARSVGRK